MAKRKPRKTVKQDIRRSSSLKIPYDQDIPVLDFLKDYNIDTGGGLSECLNDLIYRIESGYFFLWEAIIRDEQGLPLTEKQQEALDEIISFSEDEDYPILYVDELPRPSEPWYEILSASLRISISEIEF